MTAGYEERRRGKEGASLRSKKEELPANVNSGAPNSNGWRSGQEGVHHAKKYREAPCYAVLATAQENAGRSQRAEGEQVYKILGVA